MFLTVLPMTLLVIINHEFLLFGVLVVSLVINLMPCV